ncbi:uncharacterized protein LOC123009097 isoform X2 [Tribolium madens]|uniref:uncharacterized protein LOC123009097 isoform X2 n=1 Tax=Tribolium madens TaxID=41895 RepID=UPI001CF72430|nr:uncharacterized protein LOC123009097 isoform X2 [Tribolium madens]
MADDEYNRKLESLQQYIPFLNNMIVQLKDPRKKNREQQLTKMMSLHSMITDKKKKLKLETLIKCEDVILKLYDKVKSGSQSQSHFNSEPSLTPGPPPTSSKYSPITPSSPSPPRDIPKTQPVVIPTEKIPDKESKLTKSSSSSYNKPKIDIYSSAGDSLKSKSYEKSSVFERLGKKGPDMSKPPISYADLEALQDDSVDTERLSLNELTDLREKLQKQLKASDDSSDSSRDLLINTTVRNTTILTKKSVEKSVSSDSKVKPVEVKPVVKPVPVTKPVKVIKEAASVFGNTLSSIDNQILEGSKKERRSSISKKESERRNSNEKKSDISSHKKTEKRSSTEHKHKEKIDDTKLSKNDEKVNNKDDKPKTEQVFKRLADKYNPKPRKPQPEPTPPPKVLETPPLIIDKPQSKSPVTPPILPLPSPTSSTHSADSEIASYNKKPIPVPIFNPNQPPPNLTPTPHHIPNFVNNIVTNPNTSTLVNNLVNQFQAKPNFPPNQPQFRPQFPPGNYPHWPNQCPSPYPQRPFTPLPNQFEQIQPNFPPPPVVGGPTPTFNHQPQDGLFGKKDRDMRPRDDWRRSRSREPNRDPRLHSRSFDSRPTTPRRESKEYEFKDPRLNRNSRYDNETDRSRSRSRESEDSNTFSSPLDSLYSSNDGYRKTGKGYGVQNFKIPKIKREEEDVSKPEVGEPKPCTSEVIEENKTSECEDNVVLGSVSSSTECEKKNETVEENVEVGEISSTNDIQENQSRDEAKPEDQTEIINKFLKTLLENERTRAAASMFIDTVSNSLDDEKLKMVVQKVKAVSEEEEKRQLIRRKMKLKSAKLKAQLLKKKKAVQRKMRLRRERLAKLGKTEKEETKKEEEKVKEEEVLVSVGERIKNRKRMASSKTPKRKKSKHKTELDLLHEDIQDMFIRDGVLTATGKRMCRLLKNDEAKTPPQPETPSRARRITRSVPEKFDSEQLKEMSNVRVLIPKISVDKLTIDDETQRYSLRRSNKTTKSYAEEDSDEEKDKEKSTNEEEKQESSEEKEPPVEKLPETPKRIRKRTKSWASGIIPKQKRKKIIVEEEEQEEEEIVEEKEDEKTEFIEPDKNYYSSNSWHFKSPCKLCPYFGKNITKHYRSKHPDSEVLSSRLRPDKAEKAIKASIELKLDESEDVALASTRQYAFKCRFCDIEMNSKPTNFFDHVTTHTGEYRHLCTLCQFSASNCKPLKNHYEKIHKKNYYSRVVWIKSRIYGYICLECNFVQMNRKAVENHINVYHLEEGNKIMKIHLSLYDDATLKRNLTRMKKAQIVEDAKEEEIEEPKVKRIKTPKRESPEPVIKKEKEIDMTVFTCKTDIDEENEKIEQERLRKMAELNETVKTNRQSLNFIDELSNRLLQEEKEAPEPEIMFVKNEPLDLEPDEPEIEPQPEITSKKPLKIIETPLTTTMDVVQKDNIKIQGMIEKLQVKLKDGVEGPPPLTPLIERKTDESGDNLISAGFLNISKLEDGLEYVCRVPSCLFSTKLRDRFVTHWEEDHTRINENYKMTKCKICQIEITSSVESPLLSEFFAHVESQHLETPVLRTRRLSGDKLSKKEEEEEENPWGIKISDVISLAEDPPKVPPLSPIKERQSPKIESVVLKEAKLTSVEKEAKWKSNEAMSKFLRCPRALYKCPQYFCMFASSLRPLFDNHIKIHSPTNEQLMCCVYCDVKTPLNQASLHIDLRHSNCLYSCSQCLYRALMREYVMVHLKLRHPSDDRIIALSPKQAKTIMMSKQKKFTVKEACPPYKCGHEDCTSHFLFINEYYNHVVKSHEGLMSCGYENNDVKCPYKCGSIDNLIDHYRSHNCYPLHCLLCTVGCVELYSMLEHYSLLHPSMVPEVVDRRNSPKESRVGHFYYYNDEAFAKVRHVPSTEILSTIVTKRFTVVPVDAPIELPPKPSTPEPKNVTLVPLSLIQPNKTPEAGKIIAIFPNSNDPVKIFSPSTKQKKETDFVFASSEKDDPIRVDEGDNSTDPLSLETDSNVMISGDESDSQEPTDGSVTKNYGLIGYQLFRCGFCEISFSNARNFRTHCMNSKQCRDDSTNKPFKCVHCERMFKNPNGLLEHIQYHGQLRFCCSLCVRRFPSSFSLRLHMRGKHNVTNTITTPLTPNKTNPECDEFVLRPVPLIEPTDAQSTTIPIERDAYGPDEINDLPKRCIFTSEIKCALCAYSTKVRSNLVRHLQFHSAEKSVPETAPVNPVPCLEKNEKMFDKMTNLAISSFTATSSRMGGPKTETVQVPAYVPSHRRYVCCAPNCNYLCLEESNLRHHLFALHVEEASFTCAHCKINLKMDIEGYLKHLKLHDLHLYKCSHCSFVHNLRHKVDKHAGDKHPDKTTNTITVRALEAELLENDQSIAPVGVTNIKWTKPWHCGMCKYRCAAKDDIVTHIFNKHDINTQFKCTLCSYKTNERKTFSGHFKENHPDNDIDIIYVYYKSVEGATSTSGQKQFDTTPLWQRDRPRVRHIRGILFEETPQKGKKLVTGRVPITSTPSTSGTSNLDLAIEAVAKGTDEYTSDKMEETKEESVILIDDEEEDNEEVDGELMIDVEKVKSDEEKEYLSEEKLMQKYGMLCLPMNRSFKCPICFKFKTKKISYFVYHILGELKCQRYKCKVCDFGCITMDTMLSHCLDVHDSVATDSITDIPLDQTVEFWLQMLIKYQAKALVQGANLPMGEEATSGAFKTQCLYCPRWFKNMFMCKEHELCHWAEHTYVCGHCFSEHGTLDDLFQHTFLVHSACEPSLVTKNGPFVSKVITSLKSPPVGALQGGADEVLYACVYCSEVKKSFDGLKHHFSECHESSNFCYKVVTRSRVEVMYCCSYCHERGSDKHLKKHHSEKHEGLKFSIYQYICLECSGTYLNIKDLRKHFSVTHVGKKLTYSCVESKQGGAKEQYCCSKCPFRSCSVGGIRSHVRKHLRPIDCLRCGATFIYPTEARAHHNKEHPESVEQVEENANRLKEYETMVQEIVAAKATPVRKMLARKSTGAPFVRKEETDLGSITTTIESNCGIVKIGALDET